MSNDFLLYGLSTCVHCEHAEAFLRKHNLNFRIVQMDLLTDEEREPLLEDLHKFNPRTSFPTLVVNNGEEVIVGFDEEAYVRLCQ